MKKKEKQNLHIEISKNLDNRMRKATYLAKTSYNKDLTRKYLVTKALETLLDEVENDSEAFRMLIGA